MEESEDDEDSFIAAEAKQKEGPQATKESCQEPCLEEAEITDTKGSSRFQWRARQRISPPRGKADHHPLAVKPATHGCFRLSSSSFLAFVPLKAMKSMVRCSNAHVDSVLAATGSSHVSGAWWNGDILLCQNDGLFWNADQDGATAHPGQSCAVAWKKPAWHPPHR